MKVANFSVTLHLDKPRNLRFGMKAMSLIETELGVKISKLNLSDVGINDLAVFIWAGLVHEDPALTVDAVMDLIDDHSSIPEISEKLSLAIEGSTGKPEKNV
jgi:hypothetical protein